LFQASAYYSKSYLKWLSVGKCITTPLTFTRNFPARFHSARLPRTSEHSLSPLSIDISSKLFSSIPVSVCVLVLVNTTTFIVIGIITAICEWQAIPGPFQARSSPSAGPRHVVGRTHNGCQGKPVPRLGFPCPQPVGGGRWVGGGVGLILRIFLAYAKI